MQLTDHFSMEELTASITAERRGIDNTPSAEAMGNLRRTAGKMEIIRGILGFPVTITSGFRCAKLNAKVGGSSTSAHVHGLAVDFTCPSFGTPLEICRALAKTVIILLDWDQLIMEGKWVHIGFAPLGQKPRREVLTATFRDGVASYTHGVA